MKREKIEAIFLLAGLELYAATPIPNEYGSGEWRGPWWLCFTALGEIRVGWRKRVISIDWSKTKLRGDLAPDSDTTKGDDHIHAWSYAEAVTFISRIHNLKEPS